MTQFKIYAIIAAVVAAFGLYQYRINAAYNRGAESERVKARIEAAKRIGEMEKSNANFRKLSDRDRCLLFLRDSGLPEHHCK